MHTAFAANTHVVTHPLHVPPPLHDGLNPQMAHATRTSPAVAGGIGGGEGGPEVVPHDVNDQSLVVIFLHVPMIAAILYMND